MKVNFVTSGFPNEFPASFTDELKKYLDKQNSIAFVASDFSAHDGTVMDTERLVRLFEDKGIHFDQVFIIDNEITPLDARRLVENADVVWLGGGPTLVQIADLKRYGLIPSLQKREGITIGLSAGSINMAKRVVLAKNLNDNVLETAIYDGIGLTDFNIEPHIDTAKPEHLADVKKASMIAPIIGIPDDSFIIDVDGHQTYFGPYQVYSE